MDRDKVKFLIQSIEILIEDLKAEVYTAQETQSISETEYDESDQEVSTDDLILGMYSQVMDDQL